VLNFASSKRKLLKIIRALNVVRKIEKFSQILSFQSFPFILGLRLPLLKADKGSANPIYISC